MSLSKIFAWFLTNTRPEMHYAALVVICSGAFFVMAILPLAVLFAIMRYGFDIQVNLRTELLLHFTGTLGLGALLAGYLQHRLPNYKYKQWFVAAAFSGTSAAAFGALVNLKWGRSIWQGTLSGLLIGAFVGAFLRYCFLREARKAEKSAA